MWWNWLYLSFLLLIALYLLFRFANMMWASMTGPPIVYASQRAMRDLFKLGMLKPGQIFVDLGCGSGQSLIMAARECHARAIGIDRSLYCYLVSSFYIYWFGVGDRVKVFWGDFNNYPDVIKQADVIYSYLWPSTMRSIEKYIFDNKKTDCRVVSLSFLYERPYRVKMPTKNLGVNDNTYLYQ